MLFDLRKFFSAGVSPCEKRFTADFTQRDFSGAKVTMPVEAVFTAERQADGEEIWLALTAKAELHGECARCLDPVVLPLAVQAEWTVKERDLDDSDFELPRDEKGLLDVEEWLFQELLFQVPPVLLCSPECLGLCPVCGKKRQECSCSQAATSTPADARLSILKSLLN